MGKVEQDLLAVESTNSRFGFAHVSIKTPIAAIEGIDDFDGCNLGLHPEIRASLTKDERSRLLMVYYKIGKGRPKSICLLEESHQCMGDLLHGLMSLRREPLNCRNE